MKNYKEKVKYRGPLNINQEIELINSEVKQNKELEILSFCGSKNFKVVIADHKKRIITTHIIIQGKAPKKMIIKSDQELKSIRRKTAKEKAQTLLKDYNYTGKYQQNYAEFIKFDGKIRCENCNKIIPFKITNFNYYLLTGHFPKVCGRECQIRCYKKSKNKSSL